MKRKRIGIIGSRRRNNVKAYRVVEELFLSFYETRATTIISGGCPKGADHFAEMIAYKFNVPIKIYEADWSQGRHAGFLRNTDIANNSDILIACVSEDRKGGTEDTIKKFMKTHSVEDLILC